MNILLIYSICTYINVGVDARPRIFLNGIYTNTNKLHKHYVNRNNNVEGIQFIEVTNQDTIDIDECTKMVRREECLSRLKQEPIEYIRRLSKNPFVLDKNSDRDPSDEKENSIYGYNSFSQDYLDINDLLLRTGADGVSEIPLNKKKPRKRHIIKVLRPNKFDRFTFDLTKFRRSNRKKKYDSDESESISNESREAIRKKKTARNKRYQVVENSEDSESESSEESGIKKNRDHLLYMQSPSRMYDTRRRLQYFLPKRFHWNKDDLKELSDYWFNGPQGKSFDE